jgi:hypothetical protein
MAKGYKSSTKKGLHWDNEDGPRHPSGISSTLTGGVQLSYLARPMSTKQRYLIHNEATIGRSSRPRNSPQAEVRWRATE